MGKEGGLGRKRTRWRCSWVWASPVERLQGTPIRGANVGTERHSSSSLWRLVTGWFWFRQESLTCLPAVADPQGAAAGGCQLSAFLTAGSLSKGNLRHNPCKTKLFLPSLPQYMLRFKGSYLCFGISLLSSSKLDNVKILPFPIPLSLICNLEYTSLKYFSALSSKFFLFNATILIHKIIIVYWLKLLYFFPGSSFSLTP